MSCFSSSARMVTSNSCLRAFDIANDLAAFVDLLSGCAPVHRQILNSGAELLFESADALHEELVEVGADDGNELEALEQGRALVLGLVQHPPVELEPGELAVQIELGRVQVEQGLVFQRLRRQARQGDSVGAGSDALVDGEGFSA